MKDISEEFGCSVTYVRDLCQTLKREARKRERPEWGDGLSARTRQALSWMEINTREECIRAIQDGRLSRKVRNYGAKSEKELHQHLGLDYVELVTCPCCLGKGKITEGQV